MSQQENLFIDIELKENDLIGATPDDKLTIVHVEPETLADGKIFVNNFLFFKF